MRTLRSLVPLACAATLALVHAHTHAAPDAERAPTVFAPAWDALVGRWVDEPPATPRHSTDPPAAEGRATIDYDLDGRVLVRRRTTDIPAMNGRPPLHHEEVMTIYPAPDGRNAEAMAFDNEGHVTHFAATWSSDERTLVLLSFPEERAPRVKLTWRFEDPDTLVQEIEAAPAGSVAFKRYDAGVAKRQR